jgi:AraC-like DNA-binding protein
VHIFGLNFTTRLFFYKLFESFVHFPGDLYFIEYVTDLRMKQAKTLLTTSDWKINDIAIEVGYQPTYFNRLFKKQTGETAGEYRSLGRSRVRTYAAIESKTQRIPLDVGLLVFALVCDRDHKFSKVCLRKRSALTVEGIKNGVRHWY